MVFQTDSFWWSIEKTSEGKNITQCSMDLYPMFLGLSDLHPNPNPLVTSADPDPPFSHKIVEGTKIMVAK